MTKVDKKFTFIDLLLVLVAYLRGLFKLDLNQLLMLKLKNRLVIHLKQGQHIIT